MRDELEVELVKLRMQRDEIARAGQEAQQMLNAKNAEFVACNGAITVLETMLERVKARDAAAAAK